MLSHGKGDQELCLWVAKYHISLLFYGSVEKEKEIKKTKN
jgi:hypothetical protein